MHSCKIANYFHFFFLIPSVHKRKPTATAANNYCMLYFKRIRKISHKNGNRMQSKKQKPKKKFHLLKRVLRVCALCIKFKFMYSHQIKYVHKRCIYRAYKMELFFKRLEFVYKIIVFAMARIFLCARSCRTQNCTKFGLLSPICYHKFI